MARIKGTYLNDLLTGTDENDLILAGSGNDVIVSSDGYDVINGGRGQDTVDYSSYTGALEIVLRDGESAGVRGNGILSDLLISIENLNGGSGDDYFVGNRSDNVFRGNGGHDYFVASCGFDKYFGGSGYDTVDFSGVGTGIDINVVRNASTVSAGGTVFDRLVSIENLIGTNFDDVISGNRANNYFRGEDGNDTLDGGAGGDVIDGGSGDDTMTGGADADIFVFSRGFGNDTITDFNATGDDVLDFSSYNFATSFEDLVARHVIENGSDLIIVTDEGDSLVLKNVALVDIDRGDVLL